MQHSLRIISALILFLKLTPANAGQLILQLGDIPPTYNAGFVKEQKIEITMENLAIFEIENRIFLKISGDIENTRYQQALIEVSSVSDALALYTKLLANFNVSCRVLEEDQPDNQALKKKKLTLQARYQLLCDGWTIWEKP